MRPGARVAAAIEILSEIESGAAPADRAFARYFRTRRYAGSKDRGAVSDLVYGVLRRRGELEWRLSGGAVPPASAQAAPKGRRLLLAQLALEGHAAHDIAGLFDGEHHAPPPLDGGERDLVSVLEATRTNAPPDWAAGNYPAWLDEALRRRFGADLLPELVALNGRAPLDLRVNTLKAKREQVLDRLSADDIDAAPCPLSPHGIRLSQAAAITPHSIFRDGWVEVQDEGSQIVALLAGATPGMTVVDLCAGAGGKALALAAAMENRGQIFACDVSRRALDRLAARRNRAGVRNLQVQLLSDQRGAAALADAHGLADRVLLDVPCSGSGAWRRNPDAKWRLTPAALDAHAARQRRLLSEGAALVRPGGRLIYATCSVLPGENEDQVDAFLAANADFVTRPVAEVWREVLPGDCPARGETLLLTPHRTDTDAFFVAVLDRR